MKSGEVVLSLAAQLASWRAVLVLLLRTWATCKPRQRYDFHQSSIFLADCLNHSKQTVWESVGGAAATESRQVEKVQRKRRYADVDGPGTISEPELGPRGPTLKKQVLKGFDRLDLRLGLQPADSVDITQHFKLGKQTKARDKDSSSEDSSWGKPCFVMQQQSLDPAGLPSSIRKVADTKRSSSVDAATVHGWRSFLCLGNGK